MSDEALSAIKVLDLTRYIAGPFCTRLLADFGAQVIKVEEPGRGDPARGLGPFHRDHTHPEKSGLFLHLNTNKMGVTLDLGSSAGAAIFRELLGWADVVVENFRPGVMDRLGLSYSELGGARPDLVMTSISNFGQNGPYRDFRATEIVGYALGGPMLSTGTREREPVKLAGRVGLLIAGHAAAIATMMALCRRHDDNTGEYIDLSIMDTHAGTIDRQSYSLLKYQYTGRRSSRADTNESYLAGIYPCKDGYVDLFGQDRVDHVVQMLGMPELLESPLFLSPDAREQPEVIQSLDQIARDWFSKRTRQEIWEKAQQNRILADPVNSMDEVLEDPHLRARGSWATLERPFVGGLTYPGRPFIMEGSPWQLKRAAPLLGQHNREVYCGMLGYASEELIRLRQLGVV